MRKRPGPDQIAPVLRDEQAALARGIEELAGAHPRYGYRRIRALLDREGWTVNKKAVRRLFRQSGLKVAKPRAHTKPPRTRPAFRSHMMDLAFPADPFDG